MLNPPKFCKNHNIPMSSFTNQSTGGNSFKKNIEKGRQIVMPHLN